ncbi:MAG: SGNH/GDSL hydrolase family protein [Phycisphaerae bacterium]|nr:SGNH/GDSL hydrolase family protein [Phycisphaerae bacterium]
MTGSSPARSGGARRCTCVVAGVVLGAVAFSVEASRYSNYNPGEAGLGLNTVSRSGTWENREITGDVTDAVRYFRLSNRKVALWLGASQLHAINRYEGGDELAVVYASEAARTRGARLAYVQMSTANANLHDLLGFYLSARLAGARPDALLVGMTYDDLREPGVQDGVLRRLPRIPPDVVQVGGAGVEDLIAAIGAARRPQATKAPIRRTATEGTPQEELENALIRSLEGGWPAYRHRGKLAAAAQVAVMSQLATVMGGFMKRRAEPIPPDRQAWNLRAFDSLVALARADGTTLVVYRPPHRPGEDPFYYDRAAYDAFFAQLRERCERDGLLFADFESIVPAEYWGLTNEGRPDVFHFRVEGHRLLGAAMDRYLSEHGF